MGIIMPKLGIVKVVKAPGYYQQGHLLTEVTHYFHLSPPYLPYFSFSRGQSFMLYVRLSSRLPTKHHFVRVNFSFGVSSNWPNSTSTRKESPLCNIRYTYVQSQKCATLRHIAAIVPILHNTALYLCTSIETL